MHKKILLCLCFILCFSLTACGGKNKELKNEDQKNAEAEDQSKQPEIIETSQGSTEEKVDDYSQKIKEELIELESLLEKKKQQDKNKKTSFLDFFITKVNATEEEDDEITDEDIQLKIEEIVALSELQLEAIEEETNPEFVTDILEETIADQELISDVLNDVSEYNDIDVTDSLNILNENIIQTEEVIVDTEIAITEGLETIEIDFDTNVENILDAGLKLNPKTIKTEKHKINLEKKKELLNNSLAKWQEDGFSDEEIENKKAEIMNLINSAQGYLDTQNIESFHETMRQINKNLAPKINKEKAKKKAELQLEKLQMEEEISEEQLKEVQALLAEGKSFAALTKTKNIGKNFVNTRRNNQKRARLQTVNDEFKPLKKAVKENNKMLVEVNNQIKEQREKCSLVAEEEQDNCQNELNNFLNQKEELKTTKELSKEKFQKINQEKRKLKKEVIKKKITNLKQMGQVKKAMKESGNIDFKKLKGDSYMMKKSEKNIKRQNQALWQEKEREIQKEYQEKKENNKKEFQRKRNKVEKKDLIQEKKAEQRKSMPQNDEKFQKKHQEKKKIMEKNKENKVGERPIEEKPKDPRKNNRR